LIALDARVILHAPDLAEAQLPKLSIRPYPTAYITALTLNDGTPVTVRPIRPEDEPLMVKFHETLSERSVYLRFFHQLSLSQRVSHERLTRICFNDYDREICLVVEHKKGKQKTILGVGRLSKISGANDGEFALLVSDAWQNKGIGSRLIKLIIQVARNEKLTRLVTTMLAENRHGQHLCQEAGFKVNLQEGKAECTAELGL
jgi:acetyltransferase